MVITLYDVAGGGNGEMKNDDDAVMEIKVLFNV